MLRLLKTFTSNITLAVSGAIFTPYQSPFLSYHHYLALFIHGSCFFKNKYTSITPRLFTNVALATEQAGACDESNRQRSDGAAGSRSTLRQPADPGWVEARRPVRASVPERC